MENSNLTGLCSLILHSLFWSQLHGLRQREFIHDVSGAQSLSATHPMTLMDSIGLQAPFPLLMYPSGQIQTIVLTGVDGITRHLAGVLHGFSSSQGF